MIFTLDMKYIRILIISKDTVYFIKVNLPGINIYVSQPLLFYNYIARNTSPYLFFARFKTTERA